MELTATQINRAKAYKGQASRDLDYLVNLLRKLDWRQAGEYNYNPYIFMTMDVEKGLDTTLPGPARNPLTEVGVSWFGLEGTFIQGYGHPPSHIIAQFENVHYRVRDHGRYFYEMGKHCDFKGPFSRFQRSEWIDLADLKTHFKDLLDFLRNGGHTGLPRKIILFAWADKMERDVLEELDIDINQYFEQVIDIQKLFFHVWDAKAAGKPLPSLKDAGIHYGINLQDHHNALNDAVYEAVVLLHLIFNRAGEYANRQISTDPPNMTSTLLNQALGMTRMSKPLRTATNFLPLPWTGKQMCNVCGDEIHLAEQCPLYCMYCELYFNHPAPAPGKRDLRHIDSQCPLNKMR